MRYAVLIARILLGAIFVFFGSNSILHFWAMPTPPGDAGLFLSLLATHRFLTVVGLLMVVGGLLLLVGRFVALGLTLLGPVVVNILLFHLLLEPSGLPIALVVVALELFLLFVYRPAFYGIFRAGSENVATPRL